MGGCQSSSKRPAAIEPGSSGQYQKVELKEALVVDQEAGKDGEAPASASASHGKEEHHESKVGHFLHSAEHAVEHAAEATAAEAKHVAAATEAEAKHVAREVKLAAEAVEHEVAETVKEVVPGGKKSKKKDDEDEGDQRTIFSKLKYCSCQMCLGVFFVVQLSWAVALFIRKRHAMQAFDCDESKRNPSSSWSPAHQEACSGSQHFFEDESRLFMWMVLVPFLGLVLNRILHWALHRGMKVGTLGTHVQCGSFDFEVLRGRIHLDHVTVSNPPGYAKGDMLTVRRVRFDVDTALFFRSLFQHLVVDALIIEDLDFLYEQKGRTTNLTEVLHSVGQEQLTPEQQLEAYRFLKKKMNLHIKEVDIRNIGIKYASANLAGFGVRTELADIHYEDFSEEADLKFADDVIAILLKSIIKTTLANIPGASLAERLL